MWSSLSLSTPIWPYLSRSCPGCAYLALSGVIFAYLALSGVIFAYLATLAPIWPYLAILSVHPRSQFHRNFTGYPHRSVQTLCKKLQTPCTRKHSKYDRGASNLTSLATIGLYVELSVAIYAYLALFKPILL